MFLLFERIPHKHSSIFFYFVHLTVQNFRHITMLTRAFSWHRANALSLFPLNYKEHMKHYGVPVAMASVALSAERERCTENVFHMLLNSLSEIVTGSR